MRKTKARRKIKEILEYLGHNHYYDTSRGHVLFWHNLLNRALFDRKLSVPKIIFASHNAGRNRKRGDDGWYAWCSRYKRGKSVLCINPILFEEDLEFFVHILAHEMVHQYEFEYTKWETSNPHGKTFLEWRPRLRRALNFPLAATM